MSLLTFLAPHWLWLLAAVPLLWLVRSRRRIAAHALLRALVAALLILGLARPVLWSSDGRVHEVAVVDLSPSVAAGQRAALVGALRQRRAAASSDVVTTWITVGADAPAPGGELAPREHVAAAGSPLSSALAAAARAIPDGARGSVLLATDAAATDTRWSDALVTLEERGLPVHTVALTRAPQAPRIADFRAATTLRAGQTTEFVVDVLAEASSVRVQFVGPEGELEVRELALAAGRGRVRFAWEPPAAGFVALEARVAADGVEHALARTFAVQEPLRVLYLGSRVAGGAQRLGELVGPGLRIERWMPDDGGAAFDLARFDLALLDDVPADELGAERRRALVDEVRERGLGLVACGGEAAFGPGGYHGTELAEILPVEALQKEEKRDPSTTLVVIIDTSGSMGGERIQLAKEVARLAIARLLPHDKVGIVEFYGAKRWAAPIQPASNSIDLARALNRMDAGGGTVILPAIEEAFYGLQNVQTRYKHVLVLTDGGVEPGAFEPLLRRMADEGINVSSVLIGAEAHSEFLVDIANWGKGRFYSVPDRFNLPEVLLKQPSSSRLPGYKPGTFAVSAHGGLGWWGSVERAQLPPIAGYVETVARPGAETLIEIDGERDPLLATWRWGLGRVTTFTSEPVGPGTEPWRAWSGWGALLARVLTRTADDGRAKFEFVLERRGAQLDLVARRRRPGVERPDARRIDAAGREVGALAFRERADGVFSARWTAAPEVLERVLAGVAGDPDEPLQRLCSNPREDERDEFAVDPRGALDLARVARATGGETVALDALAGFAAPAGGGVDPQRLVHLAPLAFALALSAYLFEIFHRRRDVARAAP